MNGVYMDFSKALDKVPHEILIQKKKIKMYRIHNYLVIWILNWLMHRAVVEGRYSGWRSGPVEFRRDLC